MRIVKDWGCVAEHSSKALKLQTIVNNAKEKTLALVTYKDGMNVSAMEFSKAEAKELRRLLAEELGIDLTPKVENEIVHSLTTLPSTDINYQTALREATPEQLKEAIKLMTESGGRHATRIKACQNALNKVDSKITELSAKAKKEVLKAIEDEPKQTAKIIKFPTPEDKPKIIKLETEGNASYEDCEAKLNKEAEVFKDPDSQYVIEGLKELCKVDGDFRNNVMRKEKTYGGFMEYMEKAARNGYCIKYGNIGWIDRDTGLGLALDYYNADSEKMEAEEKKKREEEAAKRKAEAEKKKKEAKANGKKNTAKKGRTAS